MGAACSAATYARQDFVIKLAKAFYAYRAPSHRLDALIVSVCKAWDMPDISLIALPDVLSVNFGGEDVRASHTHLIKVRSGFDMHKLSMTNQLALDVIEGRVGCGRRPRC